MKSLKVISIVLTTLFFTACSSTSSQSYKLVERKPLISDQQLLISLLNRPVPEDQQLMLAFASQQNSLSKNLYYVAPVMITGPNQTQRAIQSPLTRYIANDRNAISITAPD